jgi:ABC-2 type transport system permease protein
MNHIIVLTKKEFVQMVREFKLIWLPIVFVLLGITQPVVTYYLPSILKALGGSQGITIDPSLTPQTGGEILASTLGSQFDQLGIMIIVVSMMGIIQSDKVNGMLGFILTRPVNVLSYIGGKLISNYLLICFSLAMGYFTSYLYVYYLFTSVPFSDIVVALLFYLVWVLFMISFNTMISTIFNNQGVIALISIVFLMICRIIVGLSPVIDFVNPAMMSKYAMEVLITGSVNSSIIGNLFTSYFCILLTLLVTKYWIDHKNWNHE